MANKAAKTGEHPQELGRGTLTPIREPRNKNSLEVNLRPIMLLSLFRKILAMCMLNIINEQMQQHIPNQSICLPEKYKHNTANFSTPIIHRKGNKITKHILLMDMTNAFDTQQSNSNGRHGLDFTTQQTSPDKTH